MTMIKRANLNPTILAFILLFSPIHQVIAAAATTAAAATAQSPSSDASTPASTTVSGQSTASASATTTETSCSYDGSVGTYLSCEKNKISTGVLVGAGVGITLGIFILAFGCIWASKRRGGKGKTRSALRGNSKIEEDEKAEDEEYEYEYGQGVELEAKGTGARTKAKRDISPVPPGRMGRTEQSSKNDDSILRNGNVRPSRSRYIDDKGSFQPAAGKGDHSRSESVYSQKTNRQSTFAPTSNNVSTKQNVNVNVNDTSTQITRQPYPSSSSQYPPRTSQSPTARPISNRASTVSSMRSTPPSYTSIAPPLPPATATQSASSHHPRGKVSGKGGIYAGSARPLSTMSTGKRPNGNLAGMGARVSVATTTNQGHGTGLSARTQGKAGDIPPVPSLPTRPPTQLLRTESEVPIRPPSSLSAAQPGRLTRAESDTAAHPLPVAEKPESLRQGSTAPLNVPARKSIAMSNFIPSYYQSSEELVDPLDTQPPLPQSLSPPTQAQDQSEIPLHNNNPDSRGRTPKTRSPPASRYIPRRPSDYAKVERTSTSNAGSERASSSSGSESGLVRPIPPFRGGVATNVNMDTKGSQGEEKKKPVRKYTQGAVI